MKHSTLTTYLLNLFQDSEYFFIEAKKSNDGSIEQERYARASILSAWAAFEGWINKTCDDLNRTNMGLNVFEKGFLTEKRIEFKNGAFHPTSSIKYESTENKMEFLIVRFGGRAIDKSKRNWMDFKKVKRIRDSIVHPKNETKQTITLDDVDLTIKTLAYYRELMSKKLFGR